MPDPTVLAIDSSAAHCAAALLSGGRILADAHEDMARGQSERLMPMVQALLHETGTVWADLDAIAVGIGPGNFTGIRIGVATARGVALGCDIPAIGITGFEALRGPRGLTDSVPVIVSLPSPRRDRDAIVQTFNCGSPDDAPREVSLDGTRDALADLVCSPQLPPGTRVIGHRAMDLAASLAPAGCRLEYDPATVDRPATMIARVAAAKLASGAALPRPAPLYIRPPDAAPARAVPPVA